MNDHHEPYAFTRTRSIRLCPCCLGRDGKHYPECPIPALATITENPDPQGDTA